MSMLWILVSDTLKKWSVSFDAQCTTKKWGGGRNQPYFPAYQDAISAVWDVKTGEKDCPAFPSRVVQVIDTVLVARVRCGISGRKHPCWLVDVPGTLCQKVKQENPLKGWFTGEAHRWGGMGAIIVIGLCVGHQALGGSSIMETLRWKGERVRARER